MTMAMNNINVFLMMLGFAMTLVSVVSAIPGTATYYTPPCLLSCYGFQDQHVLIVVYVYTIEFQKRGLPHMHLLLCMSEPEKIHSVAQVDNIVCAEFSGPEAEPELFATIITCMAHGPCKGRNECAPCIEDGECTKHYPRIFTDNTILGEDGYPIYRRRDTGRTYFLKNLLVNNKDVVPYNPALSKMLNCHINVEVCAGIRCVKYIHKYIFKGHDRTTLVLNGLDEVQQYLHARYVGTKNVVTYTKQRRSSNAKMMFYTLFKKSTGQKSPCTDRQTQKTLI